MLESVYLNLPRPLQNVAISAYGWKLYLQRFGGDLPSPYDRLESVFEEPNSTILAQQAERFKKLVHHAATTVPFYQKLFSEMGVNLKDVNVGNLADIFPVINKQDILDRPENFITSDKKYLRGAFPLYTSGSSGTPLRVISSLEARRINYRYYQLALAEHGLDYRSRSTTIAGRVLFKVDDDHPSRIDYFNKTQYLSSYHLSAKSIDAYINELNYWQPEFVDSYPSVLREIANLATDRGLLLNFRPRLLLTSAESLTDADREKIEAFFSAPIMDHYGCTEMAISAFYLKGNYYVHPLYSVIELEPLGEGSYSLLATGLLNFAMPLIRYAIGDSVICRDPSKPYCYQSIEGRVDDLVQTPEGRRVGRLDPAFKGIEGILFAQIVQHALDQLEIKVVLSEAGGSMFDEERLVINIRERTSPQMHIDVSYHSDIERGANGKFKSVVSLM